MRNMRNLIAVVAITLLFATGCAKTTIANDATGSFVNDGSCGKITRNLGWWPNGADFAFELMDKGSKGIKAKVWAKVGSNEYIHLGCTRGLENKSAAYAWLLESGYGLSADGAEKGGPSGKHRTVSKGPIYKVPEYLYQ